MNVLKKARERKQYRQALQLANDVLEIVSIIYEGTRTYPRFITYEPGLVIIEEQPGDRDPIKLKIKKTVSFAVTIEALINVGYKVTYLSDTLVTLETKRRR
ncbi:MAG: hypothetical protein IJV31_03070 [Clostridia bacterium]|nr:hypothetical protein [Clostridia bacterium]